VIIKKKIVYVALLGREKEMCVKTGEPTHTEKKENYKR
jgi:hypothetical protein